MRTRSVLPFSLFLAVIACGSNERAENGSTSTAEYDVVSEGAASGVAPTIGGTTAAPPPMTATNVDTTTNLAIVGQQPGVTGTGGSLAGSLPTTAASDVPGSPVYVPPSDPTGVMRRTPPAQTTPPVARPVPQPQPSPRPAPPQQRPAPQPQPEPAPPTETVEPQPAPEPEPEPPTDTSSTAPEEEEEPPPPQTDTTATNPGR